MATLPKSKPKSNGYYSITCTKDSHTFDLMIRGYMLDSMLAFEESLKYTTTVKEVTVTDYNAYYYIDIDDEKPVKKKRVKK